MVKKPEDKLQELVSRIHYASGDNLVSVVLYGSAARDDYHEQYSDVNVMVVLRHMKPSVYPALTGVLTWWSHEEKLRPPTIMTLEELRESADVFAIEMLDIQAAHKTLYGDDVVSGIEVPMNLHRVEVEHDLRTTLLRLRHHLLLTADGDEELKTVLGKSVTSVVTLFRHALIALRWPAHRQCSRDISRVHGRDFGGRARVGCEGSETALAQTFVAESQTSRFLVG